MAIVLRPQTCDVISTYVYGDFSISFFKTAAIRHLGLVYVCFWTTHDEYLVAFMTVQNLAWNRCSSFENVEVLIFNEFELQMPLHALNGVFLEDVTP